MNSLHKAHIKKLKGWFPGSTIELIRDKNGLQTYLVSNKNNEDKFITFHMGKLISCQTFRFDEEMLVID